MDAWLIVVLVIVVLLVLALIAWALSRKRVGAKKEAQAREHLTEARERQARAESARAAADEKAAALRRERAELEQRAAQQEREATQLAADADREQAKASELQQRAQKLAPHLAQNDRPAGTDRNVDGNPDHAGYADLSGYEAGAVRDSHQGVDDHTRLDLPAGGQYENRTVQDTGTDRDAASYRHTAPVTDPEGGADPAAGTYRDRDGDGVPDRSVKDRLTGRDSTGAHADSDGDGRPDGSLGERLDHDSDRDAGSTRETYVDRETVVDSDGDGRADSTVRETYVDRDGDGVPDDREGGLHRLKDRLTGDTSDTGDTGDTGGDRPEKDRPSLKERLTGRPDNR